MNLNKLRETLSQTNLKMRNLLDGADKQKGLTSDEVKSYEDLEKEFDGIKRNIEIAEKAEKREKYLNEPQKKAMLPISENQSKSNEDEQKEFARQSFWKMARGETLSTDEARTLLVDKSRSLSTENNTGAGYLVPESFSSTIIKKTTEKSYIRDLATVTISQHNEYVPVEGDDGANGWIDEGTGYPESDPTIGQITLSAYKTGRIVKVTDEALQDSVPSIEGYVAMKFTKSTIKAEEDAFVNGDGKKKPTGFLQTAEIGKTSATATAIAGDEVLDLIASLDEDYEHGAVLMMNKNTRNLLRKMKDKNGQYLWVQGFKGDPDTFDGIPIKINKYMPNVATGNKPIAYGDFSYYHIKDRKTMTLKRLVEKYADTGHVGFRVDKRVDGKLVLPEAIKVLKMA